MTEPRGGVTRSGETASGATGLHPAGLYDVLLGGTHHYEADRVAATAALAANPRGYLDIRHNRDFVRRAVQTLVTGAGVRQFLDVGTGLPTQDHVHQVAQRAAPEARVVYVDHDPVVLTQARVLLAGDPRGATDYVDADLRDPAAVLAAARRTLDFNRPVALVLAAILHFLPDLQAQEAVRTLVDALPAGSHLVLSHLTADVNPGPMGQVAAIYRSSGFPFWLRPRTAVERFVTDNGLIPLAPGTVPAHHWRPDGATRRPPCPDARRRTALDAVERTRYADINDVTDADINVYAVVGRKT
ncbi:SAM-dependent methyltransferase [Streptomyces sp. NPDC059740]|uniref:SAM-dependent methyltransferase n=1 Tax=Streptomyces sp. NPDC059740 TaxID=3346926 RepID=UPI00366856F8